MIVKLLTEHHFEFLILKGGSPESTLVKRPHCWKSHAAAQLYILTYCHQCLINSFCMADRVKSMTIS